MNVFSGKATASREQRNNLYEFLTCNNRRCQSSEINASIIVCYTIVARSSLMYNHEYTFSYSSPIVETYILFIHFIFIWSDRIQVNAHKHCDRMINQVHVQRQAKSTVYFDNKQLSVDVRINWTTSMLCESEYLSFRMLKLLPSSARSAIASIFLWLSHARDNINNDFVMKSERSSNTPHVGLGLTQPLR